MLKLPLSVHCIMEHSGSQMFRNHGVALPLASNHIKRSSFDPKNQMIFGLMNQVIQGAFVNMFAILFWLQVS